MIRLYFDEDSMHEAVIAGLRTLGWDVLTPAEEARLRAADEDQLRFAAANERAIVTANVRDFARLNGTWMLDGRSHAGIIVRADQRMSVGQQLRCFASLGRLESQSSLVDRLVFLDNYG